MTNLPMYPQYSYSYFLQLLEDIGEKFYGVRRKNPLQGMFGELFKVHVASTTHQ